MAKKEKEKCSLFEEMLMWTSYRYCIGRHTYVVNMAYDIAKHYYNKLSKERKEFTASDIRNEIMDKLRWLPFDFQIHRMYNNDELNPLDVLFRFINDHNIEKSEDFFKISKLYYDAHTDKFEYQESTPTIKSYFNIYDFDDLLPWEDLASCFDEKNHKIIVTEHNGKNEEYRCFGSWKRKLIPVGEVKNGFGTFKNADFGWEKVWIPVDLFLKNHNCGYITEDNIKEIKNIE